MSLFFEPAKKSDEKKLLTLTAFIIYCYLFDFSCKRELASIKNAQTARLLVWKNLKENKYSLRNA